MNYRDRDLRFLAIREIGCIACKRDCKPHLRPFTDCEVHHLLTTGLHGNGKRRGDDATIGLCSWHHRGMPVEYYTARECVDCFGPSYARQARAFRDLYGSDDDLLAEQNRLIDEWRKSTVGAAA